MGVQALTYHSLIPLFEHSQQTDALAAHLPCPQVCFCRQSELQIWFNFPLKIFKNQAHLRKYQNGPRVKFRALKTLSRTPSSSATPLLIPLILYYIYCLRYNIT
jgi:hypothetical protein